MATQQLDLDGSYRRLSARLEQIVRTDVRAPDVVIEDACQFAWTRLLNHAGRVRDDRALSWLARTAVHEALKLLRRECRELSLETELADRPVPAAFEAVPHDWVARREQLAVIGTLPIRQQRILWLKALGFSYEEIAVRDECTQRTVERQLLRARRAVRAAEAE